MSHHNCRQEAGGIQKAKPLWVELQEALPSMTVGVVRAAHSVEVELLEEEDVIQHALLRDSLAPALIMLMPVHALDHDGLPVHKELPSFYDNVPETHLQCTFWLTNGPDCFTVQILRRRGALQGCWAAKFTWTDSLSRCSPAVLTTDNTST